MQYRKKQHGYLGSKTCWGGYD